MTYDPATDIKALEKMYLEDRATKHLRETYINRHAGIIKANRARGMSRQSLEKIYGPEAVALALGHTMPAIKEKE